MKNVLIVDRVHPYLADSLSENGFLCRTNMTYTYDTFMAEPDNLSGLVIRSRFVVDQAVINSKPSLQFIVRIGSGVENIDVAYAEQKGIRVISTPEGNANAVAEHCLGLILSALRHIASANNEVRAGAWLREKNKGTELAAHTYGIIGYGHNGPALARLLKLLGCTVYAYDRFNPHAGDGNACMVSLEELMQKCDVISLNINYIPENEYFVNKAFIQQMAHPFVLVNSSRGRVVNTADLVQGIQSGKVLHACLDVLEYENAKLKNLPKTAWPETMETLASLEQVTLTPHVAGQTLDAEYRHAKVAVEKILKCY